MIQRVREYIRGLGKVTADNRIMPTSDGYMKVKKKGNLGRTLNLPAVGKAAEKANKYAEDMKKAYKNTKVHGLGVGP